MCQNVKWSKRCLMPKIKQVDYGGGHVPKCQKRVQKQKSKDIKLSTKYQMSKIYDLKMYY